MVLIRGQRITALHVQPHSCWAEGKDHHPTSAVSTLSNETQNAVGLFDVSVHWCEGACPAFCPTGPQGLFCSTPFQPPGSSTHKSSLNIFTRICFILLIPELFIIIIPLLREVFNIPYYESSFDPRQHCRKKAETVEAEDTSNQCCIRFAWVQSISKATLARLKVARVFLAWCDEWNWVIKKLDKSLKLHLLFKQAVCGEARTVFYENLQIMAGTRGQWNSRRTWGWKVQT